MAITDTRLLERKSVMGAAFEQESGGVAGTAIAAAASFAYFPCYELSFTPEIALIERDLYTESLAPENVDAIGTQFARVTMKVDCMGSGASVGGTDSTKYSDKGLQLQGTPQWMVLLRGCGFFNFYSEWKDGTVFGGGSAVTKWNAWMPSNTPCQPTDDEAQVGDGIDSMATLTIKFWQDGRLYTLAGCMGNVTFSGTAGEIPYATFEFLGVLNAVDGSEANPMAAYAFDTETPSPLSRNDKTAWNVSIDATPAMSSWELNMNNSYDIYKDVNKDKAGKYCVITERKPTLTCTTLAYDDADAGELLIDRTIATTTGNFDVLMGSVSALVNSSLLLAAEKTQVTSLDVGEETGYLTENTTAKCIAEDNFVNTGSILQAPEARECWLAYGYAVANAWTSATSNNDPTGGE